MTNQDAKILKNAEELHTHLDRAFTIRKDVAK